MRRAAGLAVLSCLVAPAARADIYDFQIRCNGTPVGHHTVQVREHDGETDVAIDIDLSVRIAGLELYRYHHDAHEQWRQGRLMSLVSTTDDDGDRLNLTVRRDDDGRLLEETPDGLRQLPDDVVPTSYWNPALLGRREILDSQSGKLLKVSITPIADGRYAMTGDLQLQLDYRQGRWSGLHFSYIGAEVDYEKRQQLTDSSR